MIETLHCEQRDGWAVLRIDRPHRRNALDHATREALLRTLDGLAATCRAIVLTGTDESFCAGLDLRERQAEVASGAPDTAGEEAIALNLALRQHPAACIAAVNGTALGAGLTLVNSCDLAIAADNATFGCPELGFATYASMAGPTTQLTITRKRAAWMLLTAARIDAVTAERWGLVNAVVPGSALLDEATTLAARIAGFEPTALMEVKRALDHIPAQISDWAGAMRHGQTVNATIRERSLAAAASHARKAVNPRSGPP
jgi:enoyl-CoA hydratase/carnithine racemase